MIDALKSLNEQELAVFWKFYLPKLARSIKIDTTATDPREFMRGHGFNSSLGATSWKQRATNWYNSRDVAGFCLHSNTFREGHDVDVHYALPLFPKYVKDAVTEMKMELAKHEDKLMINHTDNPTIGVAMGFAGSSSIYTSTSPNTFKVPQGQEETKMKATLDKVVNKNKTAIQIAAQLSAGKTANSFFLNKLVSKFPWYAKLFSKRNDVANNPIARMVAAQTALTLVTHFATDNKKLNYITDGMVQEALVDVTLNSQVLEKMIKELEDLVTLPDFSE
jgi:hypothetical protein